MGGGFRGAWREAGEAQRQKDAEKRAAREQAQREKETIREEARRQKEAGDAERQAAREQERRRREAEQAEARFAASLPGQARAARNAGQRFFQIVVPIENVDRTWLAKVSHEMDTRVKDTGDAIGELLTAIEDEGWELAHAGFTYRTTSQASRDKLLTSGQQIAVMGETLGVYLFRVLVPAAGARAPGPHDRLG